MKKIFFVSFLALGLSVAACNRAPEPQNETAPTNVTRVDSEELAIDDYHRINKICDHGRAIYAWSIYSEAGGVAVVENAPECKNNP